MTIKEMAELYYNELIKEGIIQRPSKDIEKIAKYYFLQGFKANGDIRKELNLINKQDIQ